VIRSWARLLLAWVACAAAEETPVDSPPIHHQEAETWGRLTQIVRPDYPPEAVKRGQTGTVDIRGIVRPDGFLDDIVLTGDSAASSIFVDALQGLVRDWRFVTPVGNDCQPLAKSVGARVSFEIDNGTPRIFVTHQTPEAAFLAKQPAPAHFRPTRRIQPTYPYKLLQHGVVADVYARIVVDRSGRVSDVTSRAYTRQKVTEARLRPFTDEVDESLSQWIYPPVPEDSRAPWIGCYTLRFRITN